MKNKMLQYLKSLGASAQYKGTWPATLFIQAKDKDEVISKMIKKFTRHTQIRFK